MWEKILVRGWKGKLKSRCIIRIIDIAFVPWSKRIGRYESLNFGQKLSLLWNCAGVLPWTPNLVGHLLLFSDFAFATQFDSEHQTSDIFHTLNLLSKLKYLNSPKYLFMQVHWWPKFFQSLYHKILQNSASKLTNCYCCIKFLDGELVTSQQLPLYNWGLFGPNLKPNSSPSCEAPSNLHLHFFTNLKLKIWLKLQLLLIIPHLASNFLLNYLMIFLESKKHLVTWCYTFFFSFQSSRSNIYNCTVNNLDKPSKNIHLHIFHSM